MPTIRRVALTKVIVEGARGMAKPYRLWDSKVPGLALRVLPSNRGTFELHWARDRSLSLGNRGAMTLDHARSTARRILGEVAEHGEPTGLGKGKLTFGRYLTEKYGPHVLAVNKAGAATIAALRAQFGSWNPKLLEHITRADFDNFKAARLRAGLSQATVNRDLDRIRAALSMAVEWGLLTENPLKGVKRSSRGIETRVRFLDQDEEDRMRAALQEREESARRGRESGNQHRAKRGQQELPAISGYSDYLMPMVLLAINTGLRRGELTQLTWEDIDFSTKVLTVRAGYAKSGRSRYVPLNREAVEVLENHRRATTGRGRLFATKSVSKAWRGLMEAASITNFKFHDLRHTFASNLVMAGVDVNSVRELLGHGDISMTLRYAHLAPEHKASAVEKLMDRRQL